MTEVMYHDITLAIETGDILITTPGTIVKTLAVSNDFSALSLMGDEVTTYEIPFARNVISA